MKTLSIVGRLGNDPELTHANSGTAVLKASVACDYQRRTRDGGYERATQWVRVTVFAKRAEQLVKVLQKGMRVAASGDMTIDEFTGRDGEKRVSVEVIAHDIEPLFDKKQDGGERQERREPASSGGGFGGGFAGGDDDTDIPF